MTDTMKDTFVRHDIDADKIETSVDSQIARHRDMMQVTKQEAAKTRARLEAMSEADAKRLKVGKGPSSDADIERTYEGFIARERDHYSKVRVIERTAEPLEAKRFVLVYGDVEDSAEASGTGPFESFDKAETWFVQNGR